LTSIWVQFWSFCFILFCFLWCWGSSPQFHACWASALLLPQSSFQLLKLYLFPYSSVHDIQKVFYYKKHRAFSDFQIIPYLGLFVLFSTCTSVSYVFWMSNKYTVWLLISVLSKPSKSNWLQSISVFINFLSRWQNSWNNLQKKKGLFWLRISEILVMVSWLHYFWTCVETESWQRKLLISWQLGRTEREEKAGVPIPTSRVHPHHLTSSH
jgi:hypothetical protein